MNKDSQDFIGRLNNYEKDHCWQYDIRLNNYDQDLRDFNLTEEYVSGLTTNDFDFKLVTSDKEKKELSNFIKRHEWLGTLSLYTTHWFASYHRDILAGVILFNMPNSFSKILGEGTDKIERLISRGACISWSPKNLASNFLMWCIKYMVKNTPYRIFSAYSDPTAKELGTIYQACNFYYIGQSSGGTKKYINPYNGKLVSDRYFRVRSAYKKYAKELGIDWQSNWQSDTKMLWGNIPDNIEKQLRDFSKKKQKESQYIIVPKKHKYIYVLGKDKRETKQLRSKFLELNKVYDYPKDRGKNK